MSGASELGKLGENFAADYLQKKGYHILRRNYRFARAEIDLIGRKNNLVVIVEVKTRTGGFYESLEDTVSKQKIRRLVKAADHFVISSNLEVEVRFDIIKILVKGKEFQLTHIENAFFHF